MRLTEGPVSIEIELEELAANLSAIARIEHAEMQAIRRWHARKLYDELAKQKEALPKV